MENKETRPDVLDSATSTQMDELERAADGVDKQYFSQLTQSYGWDQATSEQVWQFMNHRVSQQEVDRAFEGGKEQNQSGSS